MLATITALSVLAVLIVLIICLRLYGRLFWGGYAIGGFMILLGGFLVLVEFFAHISFSTPMFLWSPYPLAVLGVLGK